MDIEALLGQLKNLHELIKIIGPLGVAAIVFAESGLLIGFFLPGDSLLFTAGFLASQDVFPIGLLIGLAFPAAVLGDNVGYSFGHRVGRRLYQRPDSRIFRKQDLQRAEQFYVKHGGKAIVLARFLPVIRTFAPIVAGAAAMPYRSFVFYNLLGAFLWAVGLPLAGFFLGSMIPDVDKYLLPIIAAIIVVSVLPTLYHAIQSRRGGHGEAPAGQARPTTPAAAVEETVRPRRP